MRFIHIADMHFDAPFTLLNDFEDNLGDIRRLEQRDALKKIINYIREENILYLFISGDLYEHEYVRKETIEYINNLFKTIPDTKIFISPGNHDPFLKNSFYNNYNWNKNVYIFKENLEKIDLEDICIFGKGFTDFYSKKFNFNNIFLDKDKINILVMHGDLNASDILDNKYNPISEKELKNIGFDYVALGHIHKRDINSSIVYPGSTISFGFDELGEHGILDVNLKKNNMEIKFVKIDDRIFEEKEMDISDLNSMEEIIEKIMNFEIEKKSMYKIILIGKRKFEIDENKILKIINKQNILKIKNNTILDYDLKEISKQNNLQGLFVADLLKQLEKEPENSKIIKKAIEIGLGAINN